MLELNTSTPITLLPTDTALAITFAKPAVKPVTVDEPAEEFHLIPEVAPDAITLNGITFDEPVNEVAIIEEFKADCEEFEAQREKYRLTYHEYIFKFGRELGDCGDLDLRNFDMASLVAQYELGPALIEAGNKLKNKFGEYRSIPFIEEKLDYIEFKMQEEHSDECVKEVARSIVWDVCHDARFYITGAIVDGSIKDFYIRPAVVYALDFYTAWTQKEKDERYLGFDRCSAKAIRDWIVAALEEKASR